MPTDSNDSSDSPLSMPGDGAPVTVDVQWSREARALALYATPLVGLMTALTAVKQRRGTLPATVHVHPQMAELIAGTPEFLREMLAERALDLIVSSALDSDALYFEFAHPAGLVRVGLRAALPTPVERNLLRLGECSAFELARDHGLMPTPLRDALPKLGIPD
jgi:hypothetical protein